VIISKTPYESIKIEVFDADPQIACDMVNDIVNFYDEKLLSTHREKYAEVADFLEKRLVEKKKEIDSVEQKLLVLRTIYGIFDYPNQSREVARGHLRTVDGSNAANNINTKEVNVLKKNIEEKGGEFTFYNDRYFDLIAEYGKIKMDYDEAVMNRDKQITYANVVSKPFPADKKTYPVRWIIVLITSVATLFSSFVLILILENYQSIKRNF
jgi:uncharacterized protein involved in exopolysaccharide biosynthesis